MSLSKEDFLAFMKEQKSDREIEIKNITALVKEGVRDEVRDAMASLVDKQNSLEIKQNSLDDKQTNIESDHITLKSRVSIIESELAALKNKPAPPSSTSQPWPTLPPPQASYERVSRSNFPPLPSQRLPQSLLTSTDNAQTPAIEKAVREARKVIKFSPISKERVEYLKEQHAITDDMEAMKSSIFDFLEFEMKVPTHITNNIVIAKVFPPAKQPDWNYLYAEFSDIATVDLLFTFVMNLGPGINIDIYIPHSLHTRSRAVGQIAFDYRNGVVKHKTKIRYGPADFTLSIKEKGKSGPWTSLKLDTDRLPPLDPSSMSNQTKSPAPGRDRLPSKRPRSPSDETSVDRSAKSKKEDISKTPDSLKAEYKIPETETTPEKPNPSVPAKRDLGIFQPSSCVSPSANLNKNFTFGNKQSSIPIFKNSLNC